MSFLVNNLLIRTHKQVNELLPDFLKLKSKIVFSLLVISSIIEFLGLAMLIPLFTIIADTESISKIGIINRIYVFSGIQSIKLFSVALAITIGFVFLFKNFILMLIIRYQTKFSFKIYRFYATKSLEYYFKKGYLFVKSSDSNALVRNIGSVPRIFTRNFVIPYLNLLNDLFIVAIIILVLVFQNPLFVLLLLSVLLPFFILFYFLIRKKIQHLEKVDLALQPKLGRTLFQVIHGYLDTLVNNAFSNLSKRNSKYTDDICDNGVTLLTLKASPPKIVEVSMIFSLITIVCFGLYYFEDSTELVTAMAFFGLAAFRIMPSLNRILASIVTIKGYDYLYDYLKPVSDFYKSDSKPDKKVKVTIPFDKEIALDNISFSYNDKDVVFQDFSLKVNKHETIGLIGPSGSGKSTLMLLILGVIRPNKGCVKIDGVTLNDENIASWHTLVGIVPQEIFIVDGTIKENITLGCDDKIDDKELNRAIDLASLKEFVNSFPNGFDTQLEDRGSNLSGGQKQRIAIARAIYSGSQVIVFDEATSSLDLETEKEIKNSILTLQNEGYTIIVIAHRYTTLAHCDKVYEIDKESFACITKDELRKRMEDLF
jgi:ATP-binding cassette, subfamily B, bacterial PglK